ncbi:HNH endonuclease [Antrihabitans stalactiti]|uniref:HNH endonuclease n=1 Tax=Antrihabitans stalactiti TaxID=2584121 RepID=A0A848KFQ8_9NOCA|nr:HNH endonuclease [Antrihabitans stalactiti]
MRVQELAATVADLDDAAHIDAIRALEDLKSACAAAQARITAEFDATRTNPAGLGAEIALARRESPNRGGRHLGFARAMQEMPHTLALLESGELNEWRATLLVRETACLTKEDRAVIDQEFCADPAVLAGLGDRAIETKARARAAQLDAEAVVRRARKAVADRHVSIRPAPDTMTYVTALLPVAEGVAVWANLKRDADSLVGTGQAGDRTRGQVMADLLVERITSVDNADAQPVTVNVVISDETLFGGGAAPAHVDGYGDIPAPIARNWIKNAVTKDVAELRRLYANPTTGALTNLESVARCFPKGLARFIDIRDKVCRTPWCDAPIRHRDHIEPHENGGETTELNGAGLCAACNYAKQAPGWSAEPEEASGLHQYNFTTPSGHTYRSTAPPLPLPAKKRARTRQVEIDIVWAA